MNVVFIGKAPNQTLLSISRTVTDQILAAEQRNDKLAQMSSEIVKDNNKDNGYFVLQTLFKKA
jgi:hypothetical protein